MTDSSSLTEFGRLDDFLLLVGRLNYSWTNTESLLIHLIAGLSRTDKESAVVIFLTLNTLRARLDLVQRLAKLDRITKTERDVILSTTQEMASLSGLRNRYNHCIYAFDTQVGEMKTILMRIADRKDFIKIGQSSPIDESSVSELEATIARLGKLNIAIWDIVKRFGYPL